MNDRMYMFITYLLSYSECPITHHLVNRIDRPVDQLSTPWYSISPYSIATCRYLLRTIAPSKGSYAAQFNGALIILWYHLFPVFPKRRASSKISFIHAWMSLDATCSRNAVILS